MKYIKKFSKDSEYQVFKNGENYIVPNVCYIEESSHTVFEDTPESEIVPQPIIRATYNATSDNMMALAKTDNIKSLKIDGDTIKFEPAVTNTIVIEALASEITINMSDGTAIFPSNYVQNYSSLTIKPTDISLKCTDFNYICILATIDGSSVVAPISITQAIQMGIASYDEATDILSFINLESALGANTTGCVFINVNEETSEITIFDTTCTFIAKTGGLKSPYMFETEGVHELEMELIDSNINNIFINFAIGSTCVTNITYMKDITSIED